MSETPPDVQRALADALLGGEQGLRRQDLVEGVNLLDRYALRERIGVGGSADVFRAFDEVLQREVAVKVMRGLPDDPQRFMREMQILAALEHPGIVRVFDGGILDGRPYYVMELIEGRTFAPHRLPLRDSVRILSQVADACHAAHARDIVHRDLKPQNILVGPERAVVADFGIAKILGATSATGAGARLGTPRYMAPEQWTGQPVDARSDVFALGVMLYQALTGEPPFAGETLQEVAAQVTTQAPRPPVEVRPETPRRLSRLALRALAKSPEERPQTARELGSELSAWLTHGDDAERSSAPPLPLSLAAGVAVGLLVLVGLVVVPQLESEPGAPATSSDPAPVEPSVGEGFFAAEQGALTDWLDGDVPVDAVDRAKLDGLLEQVRLAEPPSSTERVEQALFVATARAALGEAELALDGLDTALAELPEDEPARARLLLARALTRWLRAFPYVELEAEAGFAQADLALDDVRAVLAMGLDDADQRRLAVVLLDLLTDREPSSDDLDALEVAQQPDPGVVSLLRAVVCLRERSLDAAGFNLDAASGRRLTRRDAEAGWLVHAFTADEPERGVRLLLTDGLGADGPPLLVALARGEGLLQLAPLALPNSALAKRVEAHLRAAPDDTQALEARGVLDLLVALRGLDDDRIEPDAYWRGIKTLRRALPLAEDQRGLLLTLGHASLIGAELLPSSDGAALERAAWTALRRLESGREDDEDDEELDELRARLEEFDDD